MAFNFFRKKETPVERTPVDDSDALTEESLQSVDAGYQKTQDDYNKILGESDYIREKHRDELSEMFSEPKTNSDEKGYSK